MLIYLVIFENIVPFFFKDNLEKTVEIVEDQC